MARLITFIIILLRDHLSFSSANTSVNKSWLLPRNSSTPKPTLGQAGRIARKSMSSPPTRATAGSNLMTALLCEPGWTVGSRCAMQSRYSCPFAAGTVRSRYVVPYSNRMHSSGISDNSQVAPTYIYSNTIVPQDFSV